MNVNKQQPIKAALYARVSDIKQVVKDNSLPAQITEMRNYCNKRGWEVYEVFKEEGRTATNDKRPEFQKMIALAQEKVFDVIVVWSLSRFAQNRDQSVVYKIKLKKLGVRVVSVTENIEGKDEFGEKIYEAIIEVMDEMESKRISDRTFAAMHKLAQEGYWSLGGRGPFGYEIEKIKVEGIERKKLIKNKEKSKIVQKIFQEYLMGKGANLIAADLNRQDLKFRKNKWSRQAILGILSNETYTGKMIWNKRGEAVKIKNCFEPIIDEKTFKKVQNIKNSRNFKTINPSQLNSTNLLTGLLKCSCGYSLVVSSSNGNGGKYYYYKCTASKYGKAKCQTKQIKKEALENFITTNIKKHIFIDKNMLEMAHYMNGISKEHFEKETTKQKEHKNKLAKIKERIKTTQNLLADNRAKDQDLCFSMLKDFREEERELEAKLLRVKDLSYEPLEEKKILDYARQAKQSFKRSSLTENKNSFNLL